MSVTESSVAVPTGQKIDNVEVTTTEGAVQRQVTVIGDAEVPSQRVSVTVNGALVTTPRCITGTVTSVSGSATSVTLLAANSARVGATVYNDSTATLRIKLAATASTSSFTVLLVAGAYYEVPFGYTGIIDGLWESATGAARVTELA